MELSFENLKGTGWKAKIAKLNTKSNIDLVSLYGLNKERYPFLLESSSRGNSNNRFSTKNIFAIIISCKKCPQYC